MGGSLQGAADQEEEASESEKQLAADPLAEDGWYESTEEGAGVEQGDDVGRSLGCHRIRTQEVEFTLEAVQGDHTTGDSGVETKQATSDITLVVKK